MPIYEYICNDCGRQFEELVRSASGERTVRCPGCESKAVQRRLSVFAARQGASTVPDMPMGGPCGRCGDPDGPCSL